eukprot:c39912_g1_i1 orf=203-2251(+)
MAAESASDDDDTLSELEDGESPPLLHFSAHPPSFKALLDELQAEKHARKAAEIALADLQDSFSRLKSFTFEAVQQRDDAMRLKEEAESSQQNLLSKLNDALLSRNDAISQRDDAMRSRDEAIRSRDEIALQKDVAMHSRNSSRSDVEAATRLLVAGADNITARVSSIKSFSGNLPRSSSHTGIAAVAYGFTKRAEAVVDELVRHLDMASKDRSTMREQMEQRHYHSAIEVSELEASVQVLKDNLSKKTLELKTWHDHAAEYERKLSEIKQMALEKQIIAEKEALVLTNVLHSKESMLKNMQASINELSEISFKTHEVLTNHAASFFPSEMPLSKISPVSPTSEGPEEGIQNCIDRLKDIRELFLKLAMTWKEQIDLRKKALEDLEGTITRLIVEKKEITIFLESALATKQEMLEAVSKLSLGSDHNLNTITKNKEVRNDTTASLLHGQLSSRSNGVIAGEALSTGFVLENELKKSRQEIFELQQFLAAARGELELLRVTSERQVTELLDKTAKIQDLENKQHLAQETIEGLRTEVAAANEDTSRWKQAATKEAEAGAILLEEVERLQEQVSFLKEQARQLSDLLEDCKIKLRSKEEMAAAAIAARKAAEQSLRIADERAVQLRKRIEDMARQFELLDGKDDGVTPVGWYDACWPWLRGKNSYSHGNSTQTGAEMDKLLEPFV